MISEVISPMPGLKNIEKMKNAIPTTAKTREIFHAQVDPFHRPYARTKSIAARANSAIITTENRTGKSLT